MFSILLLAAFLVPTLAPFLALGQESDAGLPACCRRNGAHHCMMSMGERSRLESQSSSSQGPRFQAPPERCPCCPATAVPVHPDRSFTPDTAQAIFAEIVSHPAGTVQVESKRRVARDRSRQKRGPPAVFLA